MDEESPESEFGDQPEFGSEHTVLKLQAVGSYLPAYTTALKNKGFTLHYVDAFAGTGECPIRIRGQRLLVPGSASIAMECDPPFHRMVFIEKARRKVKLLEQLRKQALERNITVIRGDANDAIPAFLQTLTLRDRAIVFLDPFGMQVEWRTLEVIAASRVVDLWYLFPLFALYRQAARDAADIDECKDAALRRMLGTPAWRAAFYEQDPQINMFGESADVRTADISKMLTWVKTDRLESIFPGVLQPKILYQVRSSGARGAPLFALFFAVSNPDPKARALALKIARGVLKL